jgi:enoyl-CoA hydratase/carnithine racemase
MALVDYSTSNGVASLTLNDPPTNGYTFEMMKDLDAAILEARFDPDVQVIVVTGHGERFFCAGANINMLREADERFKYFFCLHANETLLRLEHTPKLTTAWAAVSRSRSRATCSSPGLARGRWASRR